MTILRHVAFILIALFLTLVLFEFWGRFGNVMTHVTKQEAAAPAATAQEPQQPVQQTPGVVTMSIVPSRQPVPAGSWICDRDKGGCLPTACTKERPCPK